MSDKTKRWLALYPTRRLGELVMPGSHDAGVYRNAIVKKSVAKVLAKKSKIACQDHDFLEQAKAGVRFFDARVYLKGSAPTLGHFAADSQHGILGGYGGSFVALLESSFAYVETYWSEFLILRITHTQCTAEVGAVIRDFVDDPKHTWRKKCLYANTTANIAQRSVGELAGKVILAFDGKFNKIMFTNWTENKTTDEEKQARQQHGALPTPTKKFKTGGQGIADNYGMHVFKYFKNTTSDNAPGVCTCGEYTGRTAGQDMQNVWDRQLQNVHEHANHLGNKTSNHLLFLYWQQTGGNVEANTRAATNPVGPHAQLGPFIAHIKQNFQKKHWPNIISHDFVNDQTCEQIIDMNGAPDRPKQHVPVNRPVIGTQDLET